MPSHDTNIVNLSIRKMQNDNMLSLITDQISQIQR